MNAREQTRRYTAAELLVSGVVAGLRLQAPAKWIVRQATVRSAVASCVYTSGMAFLLSMVAADTLGTGAPTPAQNMLLYYPLCIVVQLLCSPRHKLIATTVQQKSQLAAAKRLCSLPSSAHLCSTSALITFPLPFFNNNDNRT